MTATVRIAQLYPDVLGITGDRGNVSALQTRLQRAGASVEFLPVNIGDDLPIDLDAIVLGNGPLSAMRGVRDDLLKHAERIRAHVADGGALLAVGGGAELLSREVTTLEGERIEGLGVFDASVERTRQRKVGYIVVETPIGRVIGFEDYASEWKLHDTEDGYGRVVSGQGSFALPTSGGQTELPRGELIRIGNAIASNVQGPLLPLNPDLVRDILTGIATRRGLEWNLMAGVDSLDAYASGARVAIETLVHGKGFNSIQL
ncbi:hypothetical protein ACFWHT_08025 [Microbacterium sp. NPDC058342]|uniref:hypothetical protein n=1 Tax=Microbacterium sp. NPDC058342 TaxID=3346454 RepID=UPI0036578825